MLRTEAGPAGAPPEGVLEAAIYVDDLIAAEDFYAGILGLEVVLRQPGHHVFFRCGSTIVLAFRADLTRDQSTTGRFPVPAHGADGAGHICFAVDGAALDGWVSRLAGNGIKIEADFRWPNGARSVYVRDPAGNSVEFAEPRLWPQAMQTP